MLMSQKLAVPFMLIFVVGFMLGVGVMLYLRKNLTIARTVTITVTTTTTTTDSYSLIAIPAIFVLILFLVIFLASLWKMRRDRWRVLWRLLSRRILRVV
jgi:phosphoglycerol transferase MdoB-like AlkP superfamily enzyme